MCKRIRAVQPHLMKRKDTMMATTTEQQNPSRSALRGLLPSILLNAAVPLGLYWLVKLYITPSEIFVPGIASVFPIVYPIYDFCRHSPLILIYSSTCFHIPSDLIGPLF